MCGQNEHIRAKGKKLIKRVIEKPGTFPRRVGIGVQVGPSNTREKKGVTGEKRLTVYYV
jgi:hypothetical protein